MPRVLKAADVYIDSDKTVQIKSAINLPQADAVEEEEIPGESPEEVKMNAKSEAESIINRARAEAELLISNAQSESESIIAEAEDRMASESERLYEEKRQAGYDQGINDATREGESIKAEAQNILDAAYVEAEKARRAVEPEAVTLIINIVEKLLGDTVRINPGVIVSLIRQGFAGTTVQSQGGTITVRVSESDFDEVYTRKDEIVAMAGGMAEVDVVRDLSLGSADCVIDTPFGGIDVSMSKQFDALKENLIYLMDHQE